MEEGRGQVKAALITHLQDKLINDKENRPDRGSPEYEWAMQFTRETLAFVEGVELK
jgi:hypothetical protein